jgi:hypothetical protein
LNIERRLRALEAKQQPEQPSRFDSLTDGELDLVILSYTPDLLSSMGLKNVQELQSSRVPSSGKFDTMSDEELEESIKVALSNWHPDMSYLRQYLKPGMDVQSIREAVLQ